MFAVSRTRDVLKKARTNLEVSKNHCAAPSLVLGVIPDVAYLCVFTQIYTVFCASLLYVVSVVS